MTIECSKLFSQFVIIKKEMPQTINPIEGWYNKFQAICTSYHPKLPQNNNNNNNSNKKHRKQLNLICNGNNYTNWLNRLKFGKVS